VKKETKLRNPNPSGDDESLYNIYTLSFNNIMGSASDVVRGRFMVSLKELEERARDLLDEYQGFKLDRLSLVRRSFEAYSALSWRVSLDGSKRRFTSLDDEAVIELLESVQAFERDQVFCLDREVQLLNANLKIEWITYLEHCRLSKLPEGKRLSPKQMPNVVNALS